MPESKSDARYKWVMLALLAFTYFLMHATRQVFNSSLTDIKAALPGPTDAEWGFTRTAFLFAYGLAVPLAGIAADMLRRKWVVVVGALMFTASVFGTGYVDGFVGMLVLYGLLNGIGQCMIPASASSLIAQYHTETRSTALSIYQSGLYFGIVLASVLSGLLSEYCPDTGWRWAFWGFGAAGIIWTLALAIFVRDTPPLVHKAGEERASFKEAALAMVSKPTAILLTFAFGMLVFGSNCFRTFMPHFLRQSVEAGGFGVDKFWAPIHSVIWFYLGSFIGIGTGARLSDRLARRYPAIRINMMIVGLALSAPAMAAMVYMPSLPLCCFMMFVFGIGGGLFDSPATRSRPWLTAPPRWASTSAVLFSSAAPRPRFSAMSGSTSPTSTELPCSAGCTLSALSRFLWPDLHFSTGINNSQTPPCATEQKYSIIAASTTKELKHYGRKA